MSMRNEGAVRAKGVQIYKSVAGKNGTLEWQLEAPLAELTNTKGDRVGSHFGGPPFGGPAWEALDGAIPQDAVNPAAWETSRS